MAAAGQVQDYLATLASESEEVQFLRSVPWTLGTHAQGHIHIIEGLRTEVDRLAELPQSPLFSLITPLWNTPPRLLHELILSVRCQSWLHWELMLVDDGSIRTDHFEVARRWAERDPRIRLTFRAANGGISAARNEAIARSSGDFLAVLDHDDLLHPLALSTYVRQLHGNPDLNLLFSNEAKINEASDQVGFYLNKPPFDLSTLLRVNYLCHFTAIRRDLAMDAAREGLVFRPQFDGVEDHDLFLRLALTGRVRPLHVPMCLYYWRMIATSTALSTVTKPDLDGKRQAMLNDLLPRAYPGAHWRLRSPCAELGNQYPSIRITSLEAEPRPKLLVMVPFRDNVELTLRCLESLERQEHGLDVQVVLINNQSSDPATMNDLAAWLDRPRRSCFAVVEHEGPFNYARMHNQVIAGQGRDHDLLLFLNNDVELVSLDCLQALAMHLLAVAECAFAGIRLEFPDGGGIQHGGIKIDETRLTCGCYPFLHASEPTDYVREERVVFAVTFACAMVRRTVFDRLGGLDEVVLPNSYGDVDIQARALEMGFRNYYYGTLIGTHYESKTRRRVPEECEFLALHQRHAQVISDWKLRGFTLSGQTWPERLEPTPVPAAAPVREVTICPPLPLRYKVADRLNLALKLSLGPAHAALKALILRARQRARVRAESVPPNRPLFPRPPRHKPGSTTVVARSPDLATLATGDRHSVLAAQLGDLRSAKTAGSGDPRLTEAIEESKLHARAH